MTAIPLRQVRLWGKNDLSHFLWYHLMQFYSSKDGSDIDFCRIAHYDMLLSKKFPVIDIFHSNSQKTFTEPINIEGDLPHDTPRGFQQCLEYSGCIRAIYFGCGENNGCTVRWAGNVADGIIELLVLVSRPLPIMQAAATATASSVSTDMHTHQNMLI